NITKKTGKSLRGSKSLKIVKLSATRMKTINSAEKTHSKSVDGPPDDESGHGGRVDEPVPPPGSSAPVALARSRSPLNSATNSSAVGSARASPACTMLSRFCEGGK